MKLYRKDLIQGLKFCKSAICNNPSKKKLQYLHTKLEKGKCILTAADSFCVKRVIIKSNSKFTNPIDFLIPPEIIKSILPILNHHKKIDFDGGECDILSSRIKSLDYDLKFYSPDLDYPMLDHLFLFKPEPVISIGMTDAVVLKVIKDFPNKYNALKFSFSRKEKPILIESNPSHDTSIIFQAIVMPVRLQW